MQKQIEFRREIEQLSRRGPGKRYPAELRKKLVAYITARREAGATVEALGDELGMSWRTVSRWTRGLVKRRGFERVQVVEPSPAEDGFTVHGRCGVRVNGMRVEQLAELLRRLG